MQRIPPRSPARVNNLPYPHTSAAAPSPFPAPSATESDRDGNIIIDAAIANNRHALLHLLETASRSTKIRILRGIIANPACNVDYLKNGDAYERSLWLRTLVLRGNSAPPCEFLRDEVVVSLRRTAIRLMARSAPDAHVRHVMAHLPSRKEQKLIILHLAKRRRRALIDTMLEQCSDRVEARSMLRFATSPAPDIQRLLVLSNTNAWRRLTRCHAVGVAGELLRRWRAQVAPIRRDCGRWTRLANALLPTLIRQPESRAPAITFLHGYLAIYDLCSLTCWNALFASVPEIVFTVITESVASSSSPTLSLLNFKALRRLEASAVVALIDRRVLQLNPAQFAYLKPRVRAVVYAAAFRNHLAQLRACDLIAVLHALPNGDMRAHETRRVLALRGVINRVKDAKEFYQLLAGLPWDEARVQLAPHFSHEDAWRRSEAIAALLTITKYDTSHLGDALQFIADRYSEEQEPVRNRLLEALSSMPPSIWTKDHLSVIEAHIILPELDNSVDSSYLSFIHLADLITAVLPFHTHWATCHLVAITDRQTTLGYTVSTDWLEVICHCPNLRGIVWAAMRPICTRWTSSGRRTNLILSLDCLRRTHALHRLPELVDIAVSSLRGESADEKAVLVALPGVVVRPIVPLLMARDLSWACVSAVAIHLHRNEWPALLAPLLDCPTLDARQDYLFPGPGPLLVDVVRHGCATWTTNQQNRLANALFRQVGAKAATSQNDITLFKTAADGDRGAPGVLRQSLRQLTCLPAAIDLVARLAALAFGSSDDDNVNDADDSLKRRPKSRERFVMALGRAYDYHGAIKVLRRALLRDCGNRRVLMEALGRAVLRLPSSADAVHVLRSVPMRRVSVAKVVIAVLGRMARGAGYAALIEIAAGRDLHVNVSNALLRVLMIHFLVVEQTWTVVMAMLTTADGMKAHILMRSCSRDSFERYEERLLSSFIAPLLALGDGDILNYVLKALGSANLVDSRHILVPFLDPQQHGGVHYLACTQALLSLYQWSAPDVVADAVRRCLITSTRRTVLDAFLIALRERTICIRPYGMQASESLPTCGGAFNPLLYEQIVEIMGSDPLMARWQIDMACSARLFNRVQNLLRSFAAEEQLHADVLMCACSRLESAARDHVECRPAMERIYNDLSSSPDEHLRRVAIAVLKGLADSVSWTPEYRRRLYLHRVDPAPMVAAVAQFIFTPDEVLHDMEARLPSIKISTTAPLACRYIRHVEKWP